MTAELWANASAGAHRQSLSKTREAIQISVKCLLKIFEDFRWCNLWWFSCGIQTPCPLNLVSDLVGRLRLPYFISYKFEAPPAMIGTSLVCFSFLVSRVCRCEAAFFVFRFAFAAAKRLVSMIFCVFAQPVTATSAVTRNTSNYKKESQRKQHMNIPNIGEANAAQHLMQGTLIQTDCV